MTEVIKEPLINIDGMEEAEDSFLDDDEDDPAIVQNLYSYYSFPDEEPTSVLFKGKKVVFVKSVETLKALLKKGEGSSVNGVSFKVMDVRMMAHGIEYDILSAKDKDKGISVLKIYGPKTKKGCTVMICKSREHDNKFVSILAVDVIKHLFDRFEATDGWKNLLEFSTVKKPSCQICKKSFCNEKNLKTHIKKYHTTEKIIKCELCDITYENENVLKNHNENQHTKNKIIKCEVCDFTSKDENTIKLHLEKSHTKDKHMECGKCNITLENLDSLNKHMKDHTSVQKQEVVMQEIREDTVQQMEVDEIVRDKNSEVDDYKVKELEKKIKIMKEENENKLKELENKFEQKEALYQANKKRMEKEDARKSEEIKKLKQENVKILKPLGQMQWNKDKMDAELKAKERLAKIKKNTILFNELIANKENTEKMEMTNKKENDMMEECDGGFQDEINDIQKVQQNKLKGFKRTTPQEIPELIRRLENCEKQIISCPQCDFVTPSEMFFNEHMTKIQTGPNCPFCFIPFKSYSELRKHCVEAHDETNKNNEVSDNNRRNEPRNWKSKKPCRYFRNGEGNCSPRNGGECQFNHEIIPFTERQECFHKQSCKYKPYCIFYHPEGQKIENWQKSTRKVSKICYNHMQGMVCVKSNCSFYHPIVQDYQDFQWEQLKKPPIMTRVPVIVKNKNPLNNLSQSLKSWKLD